jgi:ubiquinone/menaquinone biosynthesis C-methylase UbiE
VRSLVPLNCGVAREQGYELRPPQRVLDFGCGDGSHVFEHRNSGFDAYGYDVKDYLKPSRDDDRRWFAFGPSIPFPDAYFDFVYSFQVFEHVHDHASAISEISRVLKPGGASFHCYPPTYRFVEGHIYVPLAGRFQAFPWLWLWAALGVRNKYQVGRSISDVARGNKAWLRTDTKYVSKAYITELCRPYFSEVRYVEDAYLRYWPGRTHKLAPLVDRVPALKFGVSNFVERALWLRR